MTESVKRVNKEVVGESRGRMPKDKHDETNDGLNM